jgi:5-methylthioadenosine/S-adenosylhomocysteine deaminase
MTKADLILKNAYVVTMDDSFQLFSEGGIAIRDGEILSVGPSQDLESNFEADEVVDCDGKALIPGLINAHTHAPMTLLRGLADDRRLDVWLLGYMLPVEREFVTPDFSRLGTLIACAEMIRGGTTTFTDMYYFEDTVAEAVEEVGMRAILGQSILKFPTPRRLPCIYARIFAALARSPARHPIRRTSRALFLYKRNPAGMHRASNRVRRPTSNSHF